MRHRRSALIACLSLGAFMRAGADDLESRVALMARVGFCTSPSFSPDGDRLAFLSNISGSPQVWVVSSQGGWPVQVTALDDPVGGLDWSPEGSRIAISVAPGGGMNSQIHMMAPDGSGMSRITPGGKDNNWLGSFNHDGTLLALASNRDDPAAMDDYLFEVSSGRTTRASKNAGVGVISDVSRDGGRVLVGRQVSRGDSNVFLIDSRTGAETLLTPHKGPGAFGDAVFSPDGRSVYLTTNQDRDMIALGRVTLSGPGAPGPMEVVASRDDAELQEFTLTDDGTTIALMWNVAGRSELGFLDPAARKLTAGPELPAELAGGLEYSRDGRQLAFSASGAASPSDIWILEQHSGALRRITRSPHAGVDLSDLVRPELVRFASFDGLELSGWLYRPRGASGKSPVVLSFHGGPEGQERPGFNSTYQALAAAGIGVLAPNVRGSSGFGKRFVNLDNGAQRADGVRDIKACTDYLIRERVADPKRIGIMGGSYGGYMVMAGLTQYPDLFAAGANLFGVVNFETFFAHTEPWMAAISTVEYGDPNTQQAMLRELSPIHRVDRVRAPTIVLHGANDTNVPVVEAEQVVSSLKQRGVPVEYVLFADEGHGFRKTPNRIRSTVSIVRWFQTHLGGQSPG